MTRHRRNHNLFGQQTGQARFPSGDLHQNVGDSPRKSVVFDDPEQGDPHGVLTPGDATPAQKAQLSVRVKIRVEDLTDVDGQQQGPVAAGMRSISGCASHKKLPLTR